uniref:Lipoprotein n=1 Tax=viral metagenome TaxID=1070528 RepID=A0A6C0CF18_9ZZZZ
MRCYKLFLILNLICFSTSCFKSPNKIKPQNSMKLIAYNQVPSRIDNINKTIERIIDKFRIIGFIIVIYLYFY